MNIVPQQAEIPELVYSLIKEVYDANFEAIREQQEMLAKVELYGDRLDAAGIPRRCHGGHMLQFWDRLELYFEKVGSDDRK